MTVFLVLCLLLPVALLVQGWLERGAVPGRALPLVTRLADWPRRTTVAHLLLLAIGGIVLATSIATIVEERPFLFDDAFISYRYAKNLANGHSLTWNPGEAPSEGYTNLLLVLLVAPVIKMGGDPLLATRALSIAAALAMVLVFYSIARRELGAAVPVAAMLATGILTFSTTVELTMLGLETVAFTAMLLFSYYLAQRFFESDRDGWMIASGATAFLAFLLRPEVVFLPVAIVAALVLLEWHDWRRLLRVLVLLAIGLGVPLVLFLGWKLWYFGSVVPNPALVKIPGEGLIRPRGLASIGNYLVAHQKLLLLAGIGLLFAKGRALAALISSLVIVAYLLFYMRVDTLMDMHHRFLYPITPFLLVIALPALRVFADTLLGWRQITPVRLALGVLLFLVLAYPNPGMALRKVASGPQEERLAAREVHQASVVLERVGRDLATYERITEVTIGSTDAGLLPYFSGARHVDMAGLTTRAIAERKDVQAAADFFFAQRPDLVIVRARIGGGLVDYEHGVLGNYPRWAHHPGWDDYRSVAAVHNGPRHDLHFYIRVDAPHGPALERLLREKVAEPGIGPLEVTLGTKP
jgi:arabinofuranosyltransferase